MTFRLFWFAIGAGAATWWMKHHEHHAALLPPPDGISPVATPNQQQGPRPECHGKHWGWHYHRSGPNRTQAEWEEDRAKMVALGRQATDTVGEVSEAALDSLLSTVTTLKAKLAEAREKREREQNNTTTSNQRWI